MNNFYLFIGVNWFQLLKIVQKCGPIEKFDMIFHKSGPQAGHARGYAFVTYSNVSIIPLVFSVKYNMN